MSQISPQSFLPNLHLLETTGGAKGEGKTIKVTSMKCSRKIPYSLTFLFLVRKTKPLFIAPEGGMLTMHLSATAKPEPNR